MSQSDEEAIRELEHRFNAAWDAHDPVALAEALADDAQFVTVNGAWTTSRAAFRDLMQRLHGVDGPYRSSTRRTPELQVRFLAPDISIMHSRFWIEGEVRRRSHLARPEAKLSFVPYQRLVHADTILEGGRPCAVGVQICA